VVSAVDKNLAGCDEQLATPLVTRQPIATPSGRAGLDPAPFGGVGEIAHSVLNLVVVAPV
jgi:hypothetical protein